MKLQLTVKELSDIVGVPPRKIRYYDQIGLFKPSAIDPENGYHYYALEKIEELRLISYLRHINIPIKEIRAHLDNRDIDNYGKILEKQLVQTKETIASLTRLASRLEKRMTSLAYIHGLPKLGHIQIEAMPPRKILALNRAINGPIEWEIAMLDFEKQANLPPSLFIGDIGFFVDLSTIETRHATEFTGLYLFADDHYFEGARTTTLPAGKWLTLYFKGDHQSAPKHYDTLISYAKKNVLKLGAYALERVLVDHYISSDPNLYITEIQIPIVS
jgi:DNA-binding transcriptional MerR regulator